MNTQPTAVLVHGAFADASGFAGVIRHLQAQGVAVQGADEPAPRSGFGRRGHSALHHHDRGAHRPCRPLLRRRCHLPGRTRP